jgi:hypothetical protein
VDHKRHHAICFYCLHSNSRTEPASIASRNDTAYDPDHPGTSVAHAIPCLGSDVGRSAVPPNGDLARANVILLVRRTGVFGALIVDTAATTLRHRDYPPTRHSCRSSRFLPGDGSSPHHLDFFVWLLQPTLFQLSDAARSLLAHAASAALRHALIWKTPG